MRQLAFYQAYAKLKKNQVLGFDHTASGYILEKHEEYFGKEIKFI